MLDDIKQTLMGYIPEDLNIELLFQWFYTSHSKIINLVLFGIIVLSLIILTFNVLYPMSTPEAHTRLKAIAKFFKLILIAALISSIPVGTIYLFEANSDINKFTKANDEGNLIINETYLTVHIIENLTPNGDVENTLINKEKIEVNKKQFNLLYATFKSN